MDNEEAEKLLLKYRAGQCTEAEKTLVENSFLLFNEGDIDVSPERIQELGKRIYKVLPGPNSDLKKFNLWPIIATVAAVFIMTIGTWLYFEQAYTLVNPIQVADISPGGNKATLTLANGKSINLSNAQTGIVAEPDKLTYSDGTVIAKTAENKYIGEGIQTVSTPKGGQYQITLIDGTKIWLNAATTLQFSANLNRKQGQREVKLLSGEAYFEVFKDKKHPFVVKSKYQEVKVLGTHFNIEAYDVEDVKTTLLEGSVKVSSNLNSSYPQSLVLKPNEQSKYFAGKLSSSPADVNLALAWRKGKIVFKDADLKSIMATLERWYNIEAVYQSYPSESKFSGSVSRSKNISEVLNLIESTKEVHFKVEGRRVLIMR